MQRMDRLVPALTLTLACGGAATRSAATTSVSPPAASANPSTPRAESSSADISWRDARAALAAFICVRDFAAEGQPPRVLPVYGENCEHEPRSPLERAAQRAWADAKPVLSSWRETHRAAQEAVREAELSDALTVHVRDIYLQDPFLRSLVPRLTRAMAADGLRCVDCPEVHAATATRSDWAEFAPYITAHLWPRDVITPRDEHGEPTGAPRYSMAICGGLNGVSEMSSPTPALVRAGFVVAANSEVAVQRAFTRFQELVADPAFKSLERDDERTAFLRERLARSLTNDEALRADACAQLATFYADLGLTLAECPAP